MTTEDCGSTHKHSCADHAMQNKNSFHRMHKEPQVGSMGITYLTRALIAMQIQKGFHMLHRSHKWGLT